MCFMIQESQILKSYAFHGPYEDQRFKFPNENYTIFTIRVKKVLRNIYDTISIDFIAA